MAATFAMGRHHTYGGQNFLNIFAETSRMNDNRSASATGRRRLESQRSQITTISGSSGHFYSERSIKWDQSQKDIERDEDEDDGNKRKNLHEKTIKLVKILLPHVGLTLLLLSYITVGAIIFQWLEASRELEHRRLKLANVLRIYGQIFNETANMCGQERRIDSLKVEARLRPLMNRLSEMHEYDERFSEGDQIWTDNESELSTKWTFAAAILYALTVITTTGYDHVTPATNAGRLFTVFFGLLGIPLMFITAADIGKFLSEIVTRSYIKLMQCGRWSNEMLDSLRDRMRRWRDGGQEEEDSLNELRKIATNGHLQLSGSIDEVNLLDDDETRVQLPVLLYFALILTYCAGGSTVFTSFETGAIWTFVHGFFFSFNTITTIGLGNVLVRNQLYLSMIVFYVIVGLAVITMCVDLASNQLKVFFTKLHYFGRKFRVRGAFANMSDDIREAVRIIAALKKTRVGKERITLDDLKRFLEVEERVCLQPFVPGNVAIFRWIEDVDMSSQSTRSDKLSRVSLKRVNSEPMLVL